MPRLKLILFMPACLAVSSVFAFGFNDFDTDGDGVISGTEAASNYELSAQWVQLDTDVDGLLSPEEFSAYTPSVPVDQEKNPLEPLDTIESIDPVDPIDPTSPATESGL